MLTLRPACWPGDLALVASIDTSFTTERIYRVVRQELGFALVEERVDPPLQKDYGSITDDPLLGEMSCVVLAEQQGRLAGFAAAEYAAWNRRAIVRHLYVAPERRGSGVGTALLHQLDTFARSAGARCLWLETQNINYPAIRFYQRAGFRLCGLDESLYDPAGPGRNETALFFVRDLARSEAPAATPLF
jgi:ribosomal protein S18 acetylase RimI-like enzyme